MARKTERLFRETATGLRRNGWAAFSAISTGFVALFLLGLALLGRREVNLVIGKAQAVPVQIYMNQGIDTTSPEFIAIQDKLASMSEVKSFTACGLTCAFDRAKQMFGPSSPLINGATVGTFPSSFSVTLKDVHQYAVIRAQLGSYPGIQQINDQADFLNRLFAVTAWLRWGVLFVAVLMLVSAAFLIANTVRMGLFARRREIGIMKLVGATNWFIRLPFLIEGVIEGLTGAGLAVAVLVVLKRLFINRLYSSIKFIPWITTHDVFAVVPWVVVSGVIVAALASFAGMRRFLEV